MTRRSRRVGRCRYQDVRTPPTHTSRPGARLRSLNTKLLVASVLIGLVPLVAVGIFAVNRARGELVTNAGLRLETVAVESGELVDRSLEARFRDVRAVTQLPLSTTGDQLPAALDILVDSHEDYDLLVATDLEGRVIAANTIDHDGASIATGALIGRDLSDEAWFRRSVSLPVGEVHYADAEVNQLVGEVYGEQRLGLVFAGPLVGAAGDVGGVLYAVVSFERTVADIMHEVEHELQIQGVETARGIVVRSDGTTATT